MTVRYLYLYSIKHCLNEDERKLHFQTVVRVPLAVRGRSFGGMERYLRLPFVHNSVSDIVMTL